MFVVGCFFGVGCCFGACCLLLVQIRVVCCCHGFLVRRYLLLVVFVRCVSVVLWRCLLFVFVLCVVCSLLLVVRLLFDVHCVLSFDGCLSLFSVACSLFDVVVLFRLWLLFVGECCFVCSHLEFVV